MKCARISIRSFLSDLLAEGVFLALVARLNCNVLHIGSSLRDYLCSVDGRLRVVHRIDESSSTFAAALLSLLSLNGLHQTVTLLS